MDMLSHASGEQVQLWFLDSLLECADMIKSHVAASVSKISWSLRDRQTCLDDFPEALEKRKKVTLVPLSTWSPGTMDMSFCYHPKESNPLVLEGED